MNEHRYRCRGCRHLYICECEFPDTRHTRCPMCTPYICECKDDGDCWSYAESRVEFEDGRKAFYCDHHVLVMDEGTVTEITEALAPLAEPFRVVEP